MRSAESVARGGLVTASAAHEAAAALDQTSFQRLYRALARPLWGYLYRVIGTSADADDLLQETFLRYVQAPLATIDEHQVRAYLFRIASNLAIDHLRRRGREARHVAQGADAAGEVRGPDDEALARRHDMARTFRKLPARQRVLLWLAYVEESTHGEIAGAMGLRKGSVPVLLFRARRKLARLLKGGGWEG